MLPVLPLPLLEPSVPWCWLPSGESGWGPVPQLEAGQGEEDDGAMAGELLSPHPQQGWEADVPTSLPSGPLWRSVCIQPSSVAP